MTNEEKKAVETLKSDLAFSKSLRKRFRDEQQEKDYETILNLLEKQDNRIKELESDKEINVKMIDLMAEQLKTPINSKKDVVEYFENLAKENGVDDK
jgi:hypothetical protein